MTFKVFAAVTSAVAVVCALALPRPACASPGDILWDAEYASLPGVESDTAGGVARTPDGSLLVAGSRIEASGNCDYLTFKYTPDGEYAWVSAFDNSWQDIGRAVAVGKNGDVIVAGASYNLENPRDSYSSSYYTDYHVVRYSPTGEKLSEMTASGFRKNNDPAAVVVDGEGFIYVTGHAMNTPNTQPVYYTVKFDQYGQRLWERMEDWLDEGTATGAALDPDGNLVVTGYVKDPANGTYDIRTLRYPPDGSSPQVDLAYNNIYEDEKAHAVAVDSDGCVVVAGESSQVGGVALLLKYSAKGDLLWTQRYSGTAYENHADAVALDMYGRIYAAGRAQKADGSGDFLLLVYDTDGTLLGEFTYPAAGDGSAAGVLVEPDGNVVITGTVSPEREPGVVRTLRVEGYPSPLTKELVPEDILDGAYRLTLARPPDRMLRAVTLRAVRSDPDDAYSAVTFTATPSMPPGDYEYRFYAAGVESMHDWAPVTEYMDSNVWKYRPAPGEERPVRVMAAVRTKGSGLAYEAKAEAVLGPDR